MAKKRAPRNQTLILAPGDRARYGARPFVLSGPISAAALVNHTVNQDLLAILPWLPARFVDLLFLDPPYNLRKTFASLKVQEQTQDDYVRWIESWLPDLLRTLKPTASVYCCGDWRSAGALQQVLGKYLIIHNRITWERDKGRGAKKNWKNCAEDIWFASVSPHYTFHVDAVKLHKKVIAPYTDAAGRPKDWQRTRNGNLRLTHPSNIWTDLTIPFWSMPENTDHPTQKPEKLLAKIILASSNPGDVVFDPFFGSGTALVTAKKLGRRFAGVERARTYCLLAEKRLELADSEPTIQGYRDGVFWERNSQVTATDGPRAKGQQ